jgi:hypothetical protein
VIAGAIAGALLLAAAAVVAVLCRRRRGDDRLTSDSAEVPHDIEFVESTLHETLVTYSDTMTVEGGPPNGVFTFPDDHSRFHSLI